MVVREMDCERADMTFCVQWFGFVGIFSFYPLVACGIYLFMKPIIDTSNDTTQIYDSHQFLLFYSLFYFSTSAHLVLCDAHNGRLVEVGNKNIC